MGIMLGISVANHPYEFVCYMAFLGIQNVVDAFIMVGIKVLIILGN
jgi:hypothetical protein